MFFKNKQKKNYVIRESLLLSDKTEGVYLSLICYLDTFDVCVVLLNSELNVVKKVLKVDENSHITKVINNYFVFTIKDGIDVVYVYDEFFNLLTKVPLGKLGISSVCSNDTNIYAYSDNRNEVILFDDELQVLSNVLNKFSINKENSQVNKGVVLTCSSDDFFSIPRFIPETEEQYMQYKRIIDTVTKETKSTGNDFINSCAFDDFEKLLYIAMNNIIFVIDENFQIDYMSFKGYNITSCYYDNSQQMLVVNSVDRKNNPIIMTLNNSMIKEKMYKDNVSFDGNDSGIKRLN